MTAADIVRNYVDVVWNQGDLSRVRELLADPSYRHDTDIGVTQSLSVFTLEDQFERLKHAQQHAGRIHFEIIKLLEQGDYVTMIYDLTYQPKDSQEAQSMKDKGYYFNDAGKMQSKGIEVFRLKDNKIVETWITQGPWMPGHWGETKTDELSSSEQHSNSPREVIREYVTRMWNKADASAIEDYLAPLCWRHDAGEPDRQFMQFDHAFQRQRAHEGYENGKFNFQPILLLESGEYVTFVWNLNFMLSKEELIEGMRQRGAELDEDGAVLMKGMEVFHVVDGKVVEVWVGQCWDFKGHWGASQTVDDAPLPFEVKW